ncbi:f-box protein [Quercus suber]|uniref:F-box protein n=1 Tax=Quercus suber TaxID=58331 RepID=A0AAW0M4P7_QUESU
MDVSFPLDKAKKKNLRKKQNANKSRKGINNFPDPILQHVLSYLSTKEAVRTSILSKRWKYLWTSIPKIDFNEGAPDGRMMFMKFVERVLALHGPSNIKRFSLSCNVQYDTSRITAWMRSVVKHKRLTLEKVIFSDDHSTQQLFTGCPILEDLCLIDCIWKYVKAVCISSPMLRRLFISDRYLFTEKYGENDDKDDLNADADENDSNGSQVVILGTSLKWFAFDGELINDCCFCNSSSVVDASIEAFERNEVDCYQDAHRVFKLLSGLSSVEKLVLNHAEELFAHLPVFYKLTRLSLESLETLFTCGAVQTILQNSPCLDFLEFQMVVCLPAYDQNYDWVLDPVPACFVTHLKTIKISEFPRDENEMNAVFGETKDVTTIDLVDFGI